MANARCRPVAVRVHGLGRPSGRQGFAKGMGPLLSGDGRVRTDDRARSRSPQPGRRRLSSPPAAVRFTVVFPVKRSAVSALDLEAAGRSLGANPFGRRRRRGPAARGLTALAGTWVVAAVALGGLAQPSPNAAAVPDTKGWCGPARAHPAQDASTGRASAAPRARDHGCPAACCLIPVGTAVPPAVPGATGVRAGAVRLLVGALLVRHGRTGAPFALGPPRPA
jgi:hypothetical protein